MSVRTSQETHYISAKNANRLMLFRQKSLFSVTIIRNTQVHSVGRIQGFSMLKPLVHALNG
jgi:hypothetical protein